MVSPIGRVAVIRGDEDAPHLNQGIQGSPNEVERAYSALSTASEELGRAITRLDGRLQAVMRPFSSEKTLDGPVAPGSDVPLAQALLQIANHLWVHLAHLADINDRIEV